MINRKGAPKSKYRIDGNGILLVSSPRFLKINLQFLDIYDIIQ